MCNLKVSAAAQTTGHAPEGGGYISTGGDTRRNMDMGNGQPIRLIKNYNINNYFCLHGYDTREPHSYPECTQKKYGHKNEAMCCNLMGVSQVKKL